MILTYNSKYRDGTINYGGYSNIMVTDEHFVVAIPDNLPLDGAAPLLCAGITVYSPLRYYSLDKPGLHIGVVGLGGLAGPHGREVCQGHGTQGSRYQHLLR